MFRISVADVVRKFKRTAQNIVSNRVYSKLQLATHTSCYLPKFILQFYLNSRIIAPALEVAS